MLLLLTKWERSESQRVADGLVAGNTRVKVASIEGRNGDSQVPLGNRGIVVEDGSVGRADSGPSLVELIGLGV